MKGTNANAGGYEAQPTVEMPPGDAKREQEAINLDFLQEEAEKKANGVNAGTIDPSKIKPDREILVHFSMAGNLEVSNADPGYVYYWCGTAGHGWMITYLEAFRLKNLDTGHIEPIWEVVKGDMKESWENRDVTGVRRVGDTILMRCRLDRYYLFRKWDREQRMQQQDPEAAASGLLAAEEEAHRKGFTGLNVKVNDPSSDPRLRRMMMQAAARGIAKEKFLHMLREGKIPGFPAAR
jgi:hypothetical protein